MLISKYIISIGVTASVSIVATLACRSSSSKSEVKAPQDVTATSHDFFHSTFEDSRSAFLAEVAAKTMIGVDVTKVERRSRPIETCSCLHTPAQEFTDKCGL